MADIKIGAYICSGCELGERLDIDTLKNVATREGKAAVTKDHPFLCSEEGVALIKADIEAEGINRICIGACSRRAKAEAFNFGTLPVSRANLREGVIWARPNDDESRETTDEMAQDYIRMACAELKYMKEAQPDEARQTVRRLLVVGGGISGMTAALEAARAGYEVHIVEKSGELGGQVGKLVKRVPMSAPYAEPQETGVAEMIAELEGSSKVTIHLNATTTKTSGAPGRFSVDITTESGSTATENFGAIVQATGFKRYDIGKLPQLGGGKSADVVDQIGFEELAKAAAGGPIKRPSDGKEVKNVVFIQCAGQRSTEEGCLPYCSGHCCMTSVKQAMYVREQNDGDATVMFTDLRMPGAGGEDFYRAGQEKGVTFTKGVASEVSVDGGNLSVKFKDLILSEDTAIDDADLVVLATGLIPNSGIDIERRIVEKLGEDTTDDTAIAKARAEAEEETQGMAILNLTYRQGPDMPVLSNGFNDSHFICFPYETRRTGIYAAGPVRRPMDAQQAQEDATGAAMKAIQAIENAELGRAAHPRSGDLSFPSFNKGGCTQCKRCTVECPFGAIDEDEERYPQFNQARCRRCGTCMGACPVRVISFENYSIDTIGQQLKNVEIPDEFEEKPRVLVLACENDAYPALDMAAQNGIHYSQYVRIVPVRCLGSVNLIWITDALNSGYDGVMLMGCKKGVDYQCHFVRGSTQAHIRLSKVADTLQTLSLEEERVQVYEVAITDIERAPKLINDYVEKIFEIGMSPFKF